MLAATGSKLVYLLGQLVHSVHAEVREGNNPRGGLLKLPFDVSTFYPAITVLNEWYALKQHCLKWLIGRLSPRGDWLAP